MNRKHSIKKTPPPAATFVHSLFRSGSTFFYNALKLSGLYHVYHEPMHEVIASLPTELNNLTGQKEQLKALLRHNFLSGGYFDEYTHLLPAIKKTFNPKLSFDLFFMDAHDKSAELNGSRLTTNQNTYFYSEIHGINGIHTKLTTTFQQRLDSSIPNQIFLQF